VVNLGGVGSADRPWTSSRRELLRSSRINPTRTLASALAARTGSRPALIQASAIGWYGTEHTDVPHTEDAPAADDFVGRLVADWEAAAADAAVAGVRTVFLRTAPVLDRSGGPFRVMRLAWSTGLAAKLGDGGQRMPMISLADYLRAVVWLAEHDAADGPFNLTIPTPATNAEFTDALARALHRPNLLTAPAGVLRAALGEIAEQLLGDNYVVPQRLTEAGFTFLAPDVESTVGIALDRGWAGPA
jgi:uncharacterized protein